jgi:DNA-binding LacI/PurR family transcriptional regulator
MTVRLHDIAARADVSTATVSRVLNGRPGVSDVAREAVLAAIDVLGYERPLRVRTTSSGLVGLVVPELTNPVFTLFVQTIEQALAAGGYTPVLCSQTLGGTHEDDYVRTLLERGVSGIIFVSGLHAIVDVDTKRYRTIYERGVPIALVNGYQTGIDAPFISNDDQASIELAVTHLVGLGHRRIGLAIGQRRYIPTVRKINAFHEAMRRHVDGALTTADVEEMIESTRWVLEGGADAARALLDRGATALICGSDLMALGAIRTARERGLDVPRDLSVIGSDDNPLLEFTDPPLTTIRQDVRGMGLAAVRAVLDEIAGSPAPRAEYIFRPELVVRGSTGPAPSQPTTAR